MISRMMMCSLPGMDVRRDTFEGTPKLNWSHAMGHRISLQNVTHMNGCLGSRCRLGRRGQSEVWLNHWTMFIFYVFFQEDMCLKGSIVHPLSRKRHDQLFPVKLASRSWTIWSCQVLESGLIVIIPFPRLIYPAETSETRVINHSSDCMCHVSSAAPRPAAQALVLLRCLRTRCCRFQVICKRWPC